ncbi:hypothetical protein CSUI_000183 [Cystoisospora suis]|uniref:Uncharacterized protein n=1 Tax=Cystoisospora suis TaxID=483139 RepID=A0A2C6LGN9_9APIC|nr:hypothetical protein CSUI_000183 [Cystoisospora suis]
MSVRRFSSTLAPQTEEVSQPHVAHISTEWQVSHTDDNNRKKVSGGVHGAGDKQDRKCGDDNDQLKKRREEILEVLPSYVPFITLGHHRILVYPILHGNGKAIHATERGRHMSSGAAGKEGGCGTSYEAAQLIRLLAPSTVFFSVDPPEKGNPPGTLAGTASSSSCGGGDVGLPLGHGKSSYSHLHSASVGYLQNIHGGFLPLSDLRQPLDAANAVGATVEFLDRPRASTRNRLHRHLLQNPNYLRSYIDYAAASKRLKGRRLPDINGEENLMSAASLVHHQLMLHFPPGFETLVLERSRYMAGKLLEKLFSSPASITELETSGTDSLETDMTLHNQSLDIMPRKNPPSFRATPDHLQAGETTEASLSIVVCDSVLADRLVQNLKRLFTDYETSLQREALDLATRNNGGHDGRETTDVSRKFQTYTNPYEKLAEAPPSQLPLLFFQIFILPALMGWLLVFQIQLFTGCGVGWNSSNDEVNVRDLPVFKSHDRPVELDMQWDRPVVSHVDERGQSMRSSHETGSPTANSQLFGRGEQLAKQERSWFSRKIAGSVSSFFSSSTPLSRYANQSGREQDEESK